MNLISLFIYVLLGFNGARTLYSTQDSLVIYWHLPSLDTERVTTNGTDYLRINGPGCPVEPGVPETPTYTLWFALPPGSTPHLYVLKGREEVISYGIPVFPVPKFTDDGLIPIYRKEVPYNKKNMIFKKPFLSGPYVSYLRHQRVGRVIISPFSYNSKNKEISVIKEARIVVKFEKGTPEPPYRGNDPFENLYKSRLLNYQMGKNWRVKDYPLSWTDPFQGSEIWAKIQLTQGGLYSLKGSDLEKIGIPMGISSNSIRLFTYGPDTLPSPIDSAITSMKEVAILIDDGGDGHFDSNDRLFFFGIPMDTRKWHGGNFTYFSNPYSDTSTYWLGIFHEGEGLRMDSKDVSPPRGYTGPYLTEGNEYMRHELNLYNVGRKGIRWEGEVIVRNAGSFSRETTFTFDLPQLSESNGNLTVDVVGGSDGSRFVEISLNDSVLDTVYFSGFHNSISLYHPYNLLQSGNRLKINLIATNRAQSDYLYLDYFEVTYNENLSYRGTEENIYFPESKGEQVLQFSGVPPQYFFDISNPYRPIKIEGYKKENDAFYVRDSIFAGKRFYLTDGLKAPINLSLKTSFPVRIPRAADMVVITPRAFTHTINNWVSFKENNLYLWADTTWKKMGGDIWLVPIEEIYDAFGFGREDPVAIRNFLKFQTDTNGSPPTYLLLLGDGHYDYRGYITKTGNLVPPYEPYEIFDVNAEMNGAFDDFYGDMDWAGHGGVTSDMYIGRIPVRTTSQAAAYFRKSIRYEKGKANGPWRNRVLFVADDEWAGDDNDSEYFHTTDANTLYLEHTPLTVEADKVYLIEFTPRSARGRLGHDALVKAFNRGAVLAVAFMHGNPITMTHEHIFVAPIDYSLINAGPRNPLWIIASCKISAFDRLTPPAVIGEDWALREGGAIGVISSTTLSYPSSNLRFSERVFDQLKDYSFIPQGVLCRNAKSGSEQDKYYILLGDPSVPIGYPPPLLTLQVKGEKATGEKVKDTLFLDYEGLYSGAGAISPQVFVRCFEREKDTTYHGPTINITYRWIPRAYFSGTAYKTKKDSIFGSFFVPFNLELTDSAPTLKRDLLRGNIEGRMGVNNKRSTIHASSNLGASVIVYDPAGKTGYVGVAKPIWIKPSEYTPFDTTGPNIRIFWENKELKDSLYVPPQVNLKIEISDAHGINTTQDLPGGEKGIVYILDSGDPVYLGYNFNYYPESDTIGASEINLSLGSGRHELRVKAYDNLGNYQDRKVTLITVEESELKLWDVLAYPNPVRKKSPVWFTFRANREADLQVKVFTVAGRLVWKSQIYKAVPGFNRILWSGLDLDGAPISNGLYLFKISLKTPGVQKVSKVEKLLVAR